MLKRSALPLYHQLREVLLEKIDSGEWGPGYQLPPETGLCSEFGVSRATVRQAMQLLENQGMIERIQGRGTFVGRPKVAHNLMSMFTVSRTGSVPDIALQHVRAIRPTQTISSRLDLGSDDKVFELKRKIVVDNEPLMLITSWLPAELFPALDEKPLLKRSVRQVLREHYDIEGTHQHKEVEVTILDEEEADLLGTRPGAPALLLTYLTRLPDGRPMEYRKMVVRGDRCKYFVDLDAPELLV